MEVKVIKADSTQEFERRLNELYADSWRCVSHHYVYFINSARGCFEVVESFTAVLERRLEATKTVEATYPAELKLVS
jgi:hypothetical protein